MIAIMKKTILAAVSLVVFGSAAHVAAQTVTGSIGNGTVTRGEAARGTVVLRIPGGLHVNSSRPSGEYMIPTTVRVSSVAGVKVSRVTYPRGHDRKFEFSQKPINVYEGRVVFPFTVTPGATFRGRQVRVNVSVRYQACTNEVCYAPKTKTITLTAKVN
jgi:hypothetical protein